MFIYGRGNKKCVSKGFRFWLQTSLTNHLYRFVSNLSDCLTVTVVSDLSDHLGEYNVIRIDKNGQTH